MRTYLLCSAILLASTATRAQAYGELDLNDVRARFYSNGAIGLDLSTGQAGFEVPINTGGHPLYSAGLWIGGTTSDNQTHLAAMMTEALGEGDYYPGPLTVGGDASTSDEMMAQFDHVWVVNRDDIGRHLAYYACLADPDCDATVEFPGYTTPPSFFEWPAINSEPGYDTYLANFIDINLDGDYSPDAGDVPCIMGDQAAFLVFNDKGGPHMLTAALPIGVEVQAMPFVFKWDSPALEQTVFIHYRLINRGTLTLNDTYLGFFMDPDLGCPEDDLIGSDPARNLMYVYNGDETDEDCLGTQGYGSQPPAFGAALMRGPYVDYTGVDDPMENTMPAWNGFRFGDGVADNELHGLSRGMYFLREGDPAMTGPTTAADFMGYLRGRWKDAAPLTYGGTGHDGGPEARFAFPGGTDPLGVGVGGSPQPAWSEVSAGNIPGDRRVLSSMGPFTLLPGDYNDLIVALVHARAPAGGAAASIVALQQRVDSVRTFLWSNNYWGAINPVNSFREDLLCMTDYTTTAVPEHAGTSLHFFPNPALDHVVFTAPEELAHTVLRIFDATGRTVAVQGLTAGRNTIDIARYAQGVYSCEVHTAKAHYTGRLVKQ